LNALIACVNADLSPMMLKPMSFLFQKSAMIDQRRRDINGFAFLLVHSSVTEDGPQVTRLRPREAPQW
jgi:hypothetical protein